MIRICSQDVGIEFLHRKMRYVDAEKWKMGNNGRNRTAKSRKNRNVWREKLRVFRRLEADTIKQAEMKEKNKKRVLQTNEKMSQNQSLQQKSHQRDEHLSSPPCKILETILKMNKVGTQTNWPVYQMMIHPALQPRDEKKDEEDSPAL